MAAAVISDREYISSAIKEIKASAAELEEGLIDLGAYCGFETVKTVANFVFAVPENKGDAEKIQSFLRGKGVLVRKLGEMLRITAGSKAENAALFAALAEYAKNGKAEVK